jgi:endonuclease-3
MISDSYINTFENNKSKLIKNLFKKYWYYIPDQISELKRLPWIWEKTAKVIAHVLYNALVIAVDTHVHRITNRLWLVNTQAPEQTSKLLEKIIPNVYKDSSHHALVLFWRYHCMARKPKCYECKLNVMCRYYKNI